MRGWIVAFGLVGCGRIGFESSDTVVGDENRTPDGMQDNLGSLPVQVQSTSWGSGTTFEAALSASPAAGDAVIAIVGINGDTVAAVSGGGVSWAKAVQSNVNRDVEIWYGQNASGAGSPTIQVTLATTNTVDAQLIVMEWSGIAPTGPAIDGTGASDGTSTNMTTSVITPAPGTPRLLVAGNRSTCTGATFTGNSVGWTALPSPDPCRYQAAYQVVPSAAGSYANTFQWSAPQVFDTVIVAFTP